MTSTAPTATTTSSSAKSRRSKFAQLTRTPWVPERMLQELGAFCAIDSRFRRAARTLQILWMRDRGIPNAINGEPNSHLGSYLRADAAEAGQNFLTDSVHFLALREMLLREENAAIDEVFAQTFSMTLKDIPHLETAGRFLERKWKSWIAKVGCTFPKTRKVGFA